MNPLRPILYYLKIYRAYIGRKLYLLFALNLLTAVTEGFGITLLLPLLKVSELGEGALGDKGEKLYELLSWLGIGDSIAAILLFMAIVFLTKGVIKFCAGVYGGYLQANLMRSLKKKMFDSYSSMTYQYYISRNTGHFINIINGQINHFLNSFVFFMVFCSQVIMTIGYLAMAFVISWHFALMALIFGGGILLLFRVLTRYVANLSRRTSSEQGNLNKLLVQALHALSYLISTGRTLPIKREVYCSIYRLTGYRLKTQIANAFIGSVKEPISIMLMASIIIVQVYVLAQPLAPILVTLVLFYRAMGTMMSLQNDWQRTMNFVGGVEMVIKEFDTVSRHQEKSGAERVGPLQKGIEFRNVSFAYDAADGDVLHDIDLSIPANTTVAFVGESGAGKSTLVDLLTLLLRPGTGDIVIDGVAGREAELGSWRSQLGYVSQETVIFDDTVANNISLWSCDPQRDDACRKRVEDAARRACCDAFIRDLPQGYDTLVGDRGVRLSGGQRQRLFIARELFKNPRLLILDEATSALDTESERFIQKSIDDLKGRMTVVIIAHRLSTVRNVDRIYVLDKGRVVEAGGFDELTTRQGSRFGRMVAVQNL